jgi:aminoacyl tRNA synthase complex-interacting multifunctional protein 1
MSALNLLDELIGEVESLPNLVLGAAQTAQNASDRAWAPAVPLGHTAYSYQGEGEAPAKKKKTMLGVNGHGQQQQQPKKKKTMLGQNGHGQAPPEKKKKTMLGQNGHGQAPVQKKKKTMLGQNGAGQAPTGKKKKQKQPKGGAATKIDPNTPEVAKIDIRVGKIVKAWKHPDANSLYVEHIDIGEEQPRQVCSGLFNYIPLEEFEGSDVLCIVNLKPADMRGIKSYGMVLAAKSEDGKTVELVKPPAGSLLGERLSLQNEDILKWTPELSINSKKKNSAWAKCAPDFATNDKGEACYKGVPFVTHQGPVSCSLKKVQVS